VSPTDAVGIHRHVQRPTDSGPPRSVSNTQGPLVALRIELHPHMLRHAAGYALINDGVDVRLVQEFLGHASITSTAISPKRLAGVRVR
jgi:integrase